MPFTWTGFLRAAIWLVPTTAQPIDSFQQRCLAFTPESFIRNSTRTVLEYVAADTTLSFPDNDASCGRPSQLVLVDLCRVALSIPTSNRYDLYWYSRDTMAVIDESQIKHHI